ncbi:MAG: MopE-related protein [bacterium]
MKKRACFMMSLAFILCCWACCWPGNCTLARAQQPSPVSINLTNSAGEPGGLVSVPVILQANGAQVGSLALDIGFNPQMISNPEATINPSIAEGTASDRIVISSIPSTGIFRMAIIPNLSGSTSVGRQIRAIPDGQVATVTFLLSRSAQQGTKLALTNTAPTSCTPPGQLLTTVGQGCEIAIRTQAEETCDARDNDADGQIDEGLVRPCSSACGEGLETCRLGQWAGCNAPLPQAEVCDGKDNDCDGEVDEGLLNTYYADSDGDGYGQASRILRACSAPSGYVLQNGDCDDTDRSVHPRAPEIPCNGKDDDCQGGDDTANCGTPSGCVEDDSGAVDLAGATGAVNLEVRVPVNVRYAPGSISSFGLEVTYNGDALHYSGYEKGDLTTSFTMLDVSVVDSNTLRVGGFTFGSSIPQGANGPLVWLKFIVLDGQGTECFPLLVDGLTDDLTHFSSSGGCLCKKQNCTGDLNGDGAITPKDALIVFTCYLGTGPCSDCTDVNGDGKATPSDALCIFKKYLGQASCLD